MLIVTGVPSKVREADSYNSYSEPAQPNMTDAMVYNLNSHIMCKLLEPYPRDVMGATGGEHGAVNTTYLYDFINQEWHLGPSLIFARYGHSCGILEKRFNDSVNFTAIVAGGQTHFQQVSQTVETLDVVYGATWHLGI